MGGNLYTRNVFWELYGGMGNHHARNVFWELYGGMGNHHARNVFWELYDGTNLAWGTTTRVMYCGSCMAAQISRGEPLRA